MHNKNMDRSHGTKWFTFYTKVRPWLACIVNLSVFNDFLEYTTVYTENWWLMLYFLSTLSQVILSLMIFAKSRGDYIEFVCFVKKVLLFETFSSAYTQGVQQYVQNGFDIVVAFISGLIAFVVIYLVWYRLNVKYFNKRIISAIHPNDMYDDEQNITQKDSLQYNKILYCRKCGSKLLDEAKFCSKCGTEVIENIHSFAEENNKESEQGDYL